MAAVLESGVLAGGRGAAGVNPVDETAPVWERCARIAETTPLTLEHPERESPENRHTRLVTEAGCRGAIAQAIRDEARK